MFVPGVNGSIISNAPTSSRLKGAYKNSKKRKMPNGGLELALDAASFAPPPIGTAASLLGAGLNAYQGDYAGMGLDLASAASGGASKWFGAAAGAAKMANSGRLASSMASKAKSFETLSNPVISKTASVGRDYLGTVGSSPYNNTMRVPQRDNTQVVMRPNPSRPRMPNGGSVSLDNISPEGSVGYSYSPSFKSLRGKLQGSTNILSGKQEYITPSVGASYKNLNVDYTPGNLAASVMSNKLNVNAEANFNKNKLVGSAVAGNYQLNPNLSVYGNVNYTPKEPVNYGVGFRYNKSFKEGGEIEDNDDKEMVDGVASILRRVKDKKNRLQLANQLSKQFDREKVKYDLPSFLAKSKVKK